MTLTRVEFTARDWFSRATFSQLQVGTWFFGVSCLSWSPKFLARIREPRCSFNRFDGGFIMGRTTKFATLLFVLFACLLLSPLVSAQTQTQNGITTIAKSLPDGATYLIEVPANWNK